MVTGEIGLRGYLGESIAKQWLRKKYPESEGYEIISQIMPQGIPKKGGPYLDFGIIKDDIVKAVYEVKTQDYILGKDFHINTALKHVWNNKDKIKVFETQEGRKVDSGDDIKAYLIILAPPNEGGMKLLGEDKLQYVKLFGEIFEDPNFSLNLGEIHTNLEEDLKENIKHLTNPKQGKTLIDNFKKRRRKDDC